VIEVRDGARILRFEGQLLAESSSRRPTPDSTRWIEFVLYKTDGGSYILGRIGRSLLFHSKGCSVVDRNGLRPGGVVDSDAVPCTLCRPVATESSLYIEQTRYWAQVSESPEAVLSALYKYDADGARYLTRVAETLINRASTNDEELEAAYRVEHVS